MHDNYDDVMTAKFKASEATGNAFQIIITI